MKTNIEFTAVLYASFNVSEAKLDYHVAKSVYWIGDKDIVLDKNFTFSAPVEIPNKQELLRKAVSTLKDKQQEEWTNAAKRVAELQEDLDQLLQLGWDGDISEDCDAIDSTAVIEESLGERF
jgi:hypothetical protein